MVARGAGWLVNGRRGGGDACLALATVQGPRMGIIVQNLAALRVQCKGFVVLVGVFWVLIWLGAKYPFRVLSSQKGIVMYRCATTIMLASGG